MILNRSPLYNYLLSLFRAFTRIPMHSQEILSRPHMKNRLIANIIGIIIMALAMTMLRMALFGNDPYSCMNLGISSLAGISFGTWTTCMALFLFLPVLLLERHYIQVGSFIYLLLLGPTSDVWYALFLYLFGNPQNLSMSLHILLLLSGIIISCYSASLYICSNLGLGPYDALPWIIEHRSHGLLPFRWSRVLCDFTCVSLGFLLGSIVSIGTLTMAFFTGPLISFFNNHINLQLIYGNNDITVLSQKEKRH